MLVAALRHGQLDLLAAALIAQPLLDDACLLDLMRQHHLARDIARLLVKLRQEVLHDLLRVFVFRAFQHEIFATYQPPVADQEHLHAGVAALLRERDHVLVGVDVRHQPLPRRDLRHDAQPVAQDRRPLEVQRLGGFIHTLP